MSAEHLRAWLLMMTACGGLLAALDAPAATLRVTQRGEGAPGSYTSIAAAVPHLRPGDRLVIDGGAYRESIDLRAAPALRAASGKTARVTIEGASGATVTLKGSDEVGGWARVAPGVFAKRPWTTNSQQVFIDGAPLTQVGGTLYGGFPDNPKHPLHPLLRGKLGGIWPGRIAGDRHSMPERSFYYDAKEETLYVRYPQASLEAHTVEVSVRPYVIFAEQVRGVTLQNLEVEHANTTAVSYAGAITLLGQELELHDVHVRHVDAAGIDLSGDDSLVRNSSANYCGTVGMKVRGRRNRIIGNETSFNNTRGFNKWWEAGGAKFVGAGGLRESEVSHHRAYSNRGDGLWFDWHNQGNRIHHNVVAYNSGFGIHYEASQSAQILDNQVFGNAQRGIYLPNSRDSLVANNLVIGNRMEGVAILDDRHALRDGKQELIPRDNRVIGNVIGWNGKAVVLPQERGDNHSEANLYLHEAAPVFSLGGGSREQPDMPSLQAWRARSGQDRVSAQEKAALPHEVAKALKDQARDPDWSAVQRLARAMPIACEQVKQMMRGSCRPTPGPW